MQLGAYFSAYKNKNATRFVIDSFKKNYPESPIFLISDGGDNFSEFSDHYEGLAYEWMDNILGNEENNYKKLPYEAFRMKSYWNRLKKAVDHCKSKYIMILEDDVLVNRRFSIPESTNISGLSGPFLSDRMISDILSSSGISSRRYGMCGGSVIRCNTFLEIYESVISDIENNHDNFIESSEYFLLGATDANLVYHFAKRGFEYQEAHWLSQLADVATAGGTPNAMSYPVVHNYKEHYTRKTSNGAFV